MTARVKPAASVDELRARFVSLHGEERAARAELLGLLGAAQLLWQWAENRREEAEEQFQAAWLDEQARPSFRGRDWQNGTFRLEPDFAGRARRWLCGDPTLRRPAWRASTWRALARLASATAREAENGERCAELARNLARTPPTRVRESAW